MPADPAPRTLDADDIADLCASLRTEGFKVAVQQAVWVQQLLLRLAAAGQLPADRGGLAPMLGPVFCSRPDEQRRFPELFQRWLERRFPGTPAPSPAAPTPAGANTAPARPPRGHRHRGVRWAGAALLAALVAWVAWDRVRRETVSGTVTAGGAPVAGARVRLGEASSLTDTNGTFTLAYRPSAGRWVLQTFQPGYEPVTLEFSNRLESPLEIPLAPVRVTAPTRLPAGIGTTGPRLEPTPFPTNRLEFAVELAAPQPAGAFRLPAAAVPFVLLAGGWAWIRRRQNRRRTVLERRLSETPTRLSDIQVAGGARGFLPSFEFRQLARELRRRRTVSSTELDVAATLQATLRNGGLVAPVFGSRVEPDYLLLIDRIHMADHQARLAEEVAGTLRQSDLSVECCYYDQSPQYCQAAPRRPGAPPGALLSLEELRLRHPDHRVLIFSDGRGFFDPVTGEPAAWLSALAGWREKVVLTPEPPQRWSRREWSLERLGIVLLPLSRPGLALLAGVFREHPFPSLTAGLAMTRQEPEFLRVPERWLGRHAPREEQVAELCDGLRDHLGAQGFLWLAACAAYPEVHWGLTLRLGYSLLGATAEVEALLPSLARLPWLRRAFLPDWLRRALLTRIEPAQAGQIRRLVDELITRGADEARTAIPLTVALETPAAGGMPAGLVSRCWGWVRALVLPGRRTELTGARPGRGPLSDHVFVRFMAGHRVDALTPDAPERFRRLLHRDGQPALGPSLAVLALGATLVSGALYAWFAQARSGLPNPSRTLAVSADPAGPSGFVAGYGDGTVAFWKPSPGGGWRAEWSRGSTGGPVVAVALTGPGPLVVSAQEAGNVQVRDGAGKARPAYDRGTGFASLTSLAAHLAPDGGQLTLAAGSEDRTVWIQTVLPVASPAVALGQHRDAVRCVTFSPDGSLIASGGDDGAIQVWARPGESPQSGSPPVAPSQTKPYSQAPKVDAQPVLSVQTTNAVRGLAFHPTDGTLASAHLDGSVRLWDAAARRPRWARKLHLAAVWSVAFSPQGAFLATASLDGNAVVWHATTGTPLYRRTLPARAPRQVAFYWSAAFSRDGTQLLLGASDGRVEVVEIPVREESFLTPTTLPAADGGKPDVRQSGRPTAPSGLRVDPKTAP